MHTEKEKRLEPIEVGNVIQKRAGSESCELRKREIERKGTEKALIVWNREEWLRAKGGRRRGFMNTKDLECRYWYWGFLMWIYRYIYTDHSYFTLLTASGLQWINVWMELGLFCSTSRTRHFPFSPFVVLFDCFVFFFLWFRF